MLSQNELNNPQGITSNLRQYQILAPFHTVKMCSSSQEKKTLAKSGIYGFVRVQVLMPLRVLGCDSKHLFFARPLAVL